MNEATSQNSDGIFDIYTDDSKTTKKIYYIGTRQKYTYTSSNIKHKEYGIVESGSNPYNRSTHSFTGDYKDTVFRLVKNDDYNNAHDGTETFGLRPVIKLNTATKVTGSGTKNDPFVIHGL